MLKPIEVGQIIYSSTANRFLETEDGLTKERVTKVNGSSFYTQYYNERTKEWSTSESRYSRKTWKSYNSYSMYTSTAYETEAEYWNLVNRRKLNKAKREAAEMFLREASISDIDKMLKIFHIPIEQPR